MNQSTPPIEGVRIVLGDRSYDIDIGTALLGNLAHHQALPPGTAALIVTNETVQPLYGGVLAAALAPRYPAVHTVVLMHDAYQTSVDAALETIDTLTAEGYTFVTIEECLID